MLGTLIPTVAIGTMYLGPTFAITQSLAGIRERALSGALMLFIINLIGLGLGPVLTGMLSDALEHTSRRRAWGRRWPRRRACAARCA